MVCPIPSNVPLKPAAPRDTHPYFDMSRSAANFTVLPSNASVALATAKAPISAGVEIVYSEAVASYHPVS